MEELIEFKWNNYQATFINVLGELRANQLYTDATLACGGKFYNVHKLVLSTCSDYFNDLLSRTNCNNPVIVLKDIKCEDLEALLDYMYLGEVNVCQSDLATLTKAAECLQVKDIVTDTLEELLSLKWDNHQSTFINILGRLRDEERFTDATLACEGKVYNVHRLVLSSCSDYFSDMLDRTDYKNPVIVLKDIRCRDLEFLLDYMYRGEVNIGQSDVQSVIESAECLQVKGLAVPDDEDSPECKTQVASEEEIRPAKRKHLSYDERYGGTLKEEGDSTDSGDSDSDDASNDAGNDISEFFQKTEPHLSFSGSSSQADQEDGSGWQVDGSNLDDSEGPSQDNDTAATTTDAPGTATLSLKKQKRRKSKYLKSSGITCQYCAKYFANKSEADKHIRTHTGERPFKCPKCPYAAATKKTLKGHDLTHTGVRAFKCPECPYASTMKSTLDAHVRTHRGERPFKCPECPYSAPRKTHLERHSRTHTGEKPLSGERPFKCPDCPYTAAAQSSLMVHVRTHTGERPYKCPECPYTATAKGSLIVHIRTHTGERPYKCPECPYTAAAKGSIIVHIRTHTGERPYKCPECPYAGMGKTELNCHMRTHTGERPYKCHLCPYSAAINCTLQKHLRAKHTISKKKL